MRKQGFVKKIFSEITRRGAQLAVVTAIAMSASSMAEATITLNFEGISEYPSAGQPPVFVSLFYAGGSSTIGTSGADHGVTFANGGLATCLNSLATTCGNVSRGGMGDPGSRKGALSFDVNNGYINVANGFGTDLSFFYSALGVGGYSVDVYDDANGTGNLLGSAQLPNTPGGCPAYSADFCPFQFATLSFAGTAKSVRFNSPKFYVVLDDITFGDLPPASGAVPEPESWTLMLLGFGLVGTVVRRRQQPTVPAV